MQRYHPIKIIKYKKFRTELEIQPIAQQLTSQRTGVRAQRRHPSAQTPPASGLTSTWLFLTTHEHWGRSILSEPKHTESGKSYMKSYMYNSTGTPAGGPPKYSKSHIQHRPRGWHIPKTHFSPKPCETAEVQETSLRKCPEGNPHIPIRTQLTSLGHRLWVWHGTSMNSVLRPACVSSLPSPF